MDPFQNNFVAAAVQVTGVLMVAAVLRPFARLVPGRALTYWCAAWLVQACSVGLFHAAAAVPAGGPFAPCLTAGHYLTGYLFGFLVWAGCRELTTGSCLRPAAWAGFAPFAAAAAALPLAVPDPGRRFLAHAALAGVPFAAALLALPRFRPVGAVGQSPGLSLVRISLSGLVALLWHYPIVAALLGYFDPDRLYPNAGFWKQYDLLLEIALAFGMVALASDRVQAELANRNLRLAVASDELARAARTDPLTGLLNRRALDDLADELTARGAAGCLAVLDLNDMKALNDRHGHAVGDAALRVLARSLRTLFRVTDPIFRTGGDEFLVVIPGGSPADLTGRLCTLDGGLAVRLPGCDHPVELRMAWGAAEFGPGDDLWAAARRADAAMYQAKKKSKSGAVFTLPPLPAPPPP